MDSPSWIVLLPPLLVLTITFLTKRLNLSFIISICVSTLIATHYNVFLALDMVKNYTIAQITSLKDIYIYIFLFSIGIIIVLLERSGGAYAFAKKFTRHIHSARAAETASFFVSLGLFIDDFLSNLTVGYVMRPITDRFSIPRAKLAYLVHAISTPLIILMPISSWIATLTSKISLAGIRPVIEHTSQDIKIIGDPFFIFLKTIPYIFYSIVGLISILFIIRTRISFGPMAYHESVAHSSGNLFGNSQEQANQPVDGFAQDQCHRYSLIDFIVPIVTLIIVFVGTILYTGNAAIFGGTETIISAFKNNDQTEFAICLAGITSLLVGIILAITRHKIEFQKIPSMTQEGIMSMFAPVSMLFFSSIFIEIIKHELHTGDYLATILGSTLPAALVPAMFFVVATVTALLIGTSWGTIAILLPMATTIMLAFTTVSLPTMPEMVPLLFPIIGAIFSGAVCGDQLSPISQTTLMAATSSGIDPMTHTKTQFPYAIPVMLGALCSFIVSGYCATNAISANINIIASGGCGITVSIMLLALCNKLFGKIQR